VAPPLHGPTARLIVGNVNVTFVSRRHKPLPPITLPLIQLGSEGSRVSKVGGHEVPFFPTAKLVLKYSTVTEDFFTLNSHVACIEKSSEICSYICPHKEIAL